jgi:hypothetical protein
MIQKTETRTDRLNRLFLIAKGDEPLSLESRARLECSAHLGTQADAGWRDGDKQAGSGS